MLQNDIAAVEHLPRPSVSRLLAEAGARGVVQFRVDPPVEWSANWKRNYDGGPGCRCVVATNKSEALYRTSSRLPAAYVYKSGTARDAAVHSELVQNSLRLGPQCDVALVGIGSMQRFDGTGVYSPVTVQQLQILAAQGAVGHLCGQTFPSW